MELLYYLETIVIDGSKNGDIFTSYFAKQSKHHQFRTKTKISIIVEHIGDVM